MLNAFNALSEDAWHLPGGCVSVAKHMLSGDWYDRLI